MAMWPGAKRKEEVAVPGTDRLPPGQRVTRDWPVLHAGSIPRFSEAAWDFRVFGLVAHPLRFTWRDFQALPRVQVVSDIHCVTAWSRFDNRWEGVASRELLSRAGIQPEARVVIVHAEQGYTANLPVDDFVRGGNLFAHTFDGKPLEPEHGGPMRLVVPHLYFWKSVKWVAGFTVLPEDIPGYWEQNGYHIYGDPFREQRFTND